MYFVDRERRGKRVARVALFHPLAVAPRVIETADAACRLGRCLPGKGVGIALVGAIAPVTRRDVILVTRAFPDSGDKAFPDSRVVRARCQRMSRPIPTVEVADHRDRFGVGRPDGKPGSLFAVYDTRMRAELLVQARVRALTEEVDIVTGERAAGWEIANRPRGQCVSHESASGSATPPWPL